MTQQRTPHYTDEVLAAMRDRGLLPQPAQPSEPPPGLLRYHIAVEQTVLNGQATPTQVVAILRGLADQIDPPTQGVTK